MFSFRPTRWSRLTSPKKIFYIHLVAPRDDRVLCVLETIIAIAANSMSCEDPPTNSAVKYAILWWEEAVCSRMVLKSLP
jgi:hypothetical protein